MAHVRSQIRDAVATALSSALGVTVKRTRVYALSSSNTLTYSVYTRGVERVSQRTSSYILRELPVTVDIIAGDDTAALDDLIDDKCAVAEATLGASKLGGLVRDLYLDTTEMTFDGTGDIPMGIARMTFMAVYGTTRVDAENVA